MIRGTQITKGCRISAIYSLGNTGGERKDDKKRRKSYAKTLARDFYKFCHRPVKEQ